MNRPSHPELDDADPVAPACRPTTDRIQRVLDGEAAEGLDADPHSAVCPICRERIRAARLFLAAVAERPAVRAGLTDSILATVRADRRARLRRRVFAAVGGLAVAATVALVVWLNRPTPPAATPAQHETVEVPRPHAPPPQPPQPLQPQPAPVQPTPRLSDQVAQAGDAVFAVSRPILDPATPSAVVSVAHALARPPAQPNATNLGPAGKSLADIPEAAKTGFEPLTGSARKGYNRFVKDVGGIQPGGSGKPDS
jgi:hypothetical protein